MLLRWGAHQTNKVWRDHFGGADSAETILHQPQFFSVLPYRTKETLWRMEKLIRQLCYSPLFLFSVFFPTRVTSEVGWATPKKIEEKKGNLQLHTLILLLPSPLLPLSLPLLVSPILCEKLKALVVRVQSVEVAGF